MFDWSLFFEGLGALTGILSVILVLIQMKRSSENARAESSTSATPIWPKPGAPSSSLKAPLTITVVIALLSLGFVLKSSFHPTSPANAGTLLLKYTEHGDRVISVAWSPDGKYIASCSANGSVRIWNASTGDDIAQFSQYGSANSVAWSANSQYMASAGADGTVKIWSISQGALFTELSGGPPNDVAVRWSPNGNDIAVGSTNETVAIWHTVASNPTPHIISIGNKVGDIGWSSDGSMLAVASFGQAVLLFDPSSGTRIGEYTGHDGYVFILAWSPDGSEIASAGQDAVKVHNGEFLSAKVHIWNVSTKQDVRTLFENGAIDALAWSPNGNKLAAGGARGVVHVWDQRGDIVLTYTKHGSGWINAISWSPDGNRIASASDDGTVQIWQAP